MHKFYIFLIGIVVFYLLITMRATSTIEGMIYRFRQYMVAHNGFYTFLRFFVLMLGIFFLFFFVSWGLLVLILLLFILYVGHVKTRERTYRNLVISSGRPKLSGLVIRQRKTIKTLKEKLKKRRGKVARR